MKVVSDRMSENISYREHLCMCENIRQIDCQKIREIVCQTEYQSMCQVECYMICQIDFKK